MLRPALCLALGLVILVSGLLASVDRAVAQPGFPNNPFCDGLPWYEIQAFDHHHAYPEEDLAFWGCQEEPLATPGPVNNFQRFNNTWWEIWPPEQGAAPSGPYLPPNYDHSWLWQYGAAWSETARGERYPNPGQLSEFSNNGIPLYSPANGFVIDGQLPLVGESGPGEVGEGCQNAVRETRQPSGIYSLILDYHNWYLYIGGFSTVKVRVGDEVALGQELGRTEAQGWGHTAFFFAAMKDGTGFNYDVFDPYGFNHDTLGLEDLPLFPGLDHHFTACDIQSRRVMSPSREGSGSCLLAASADCPGEPIIIDDEPINTRDFTMWYSGAGSEQEPPWPDECEPIEFDDEQGLHGRYVNNDGPYAYQGDYRFSMSFWPAAPGPGGGGNASYDAAAWWCHDCDVTKPIHISASVVGPLAHNMARRFGTSYGDCMWHWFHDEQNRIAGDHDYYYSSQAPYQTFQVWGVSRTGGVSDPVWGRGMRLLDTVVLNTQQRAGSFHTLGEYRFEEGEFPAVTSTNIVGLSTDGIRDGIPYNYMCNPWLTNYAVFDAVKFAPQCYEPEIIWNPNEPVPIITRPPWRWSLPTATPVINPEPTLGSLTTGGVFKWAAPSTPTP